MSLKSAYEIWKDWTVTVFYIGTWEKKGCFSCSPQTVLCINKDIRWFLKSPGTTGSNLCMHIWSRWCCMFRTTWIKVIPLNQHNILMLYSSLMYEQTFNHALKVFAPDCDITLCKESWCIHTGKKKKIVYSRHVPCLNENIGCNFAFLFFQMETCRNKLAFSLLTCHEFSVHFVCVHLYPWSIV